MSIKEKIILASKYHKLFQGLVAILANHLSGVSIDAEFNPKPIFKHEGGIVVNNREIVIGYNKIDDNIFCYDDYSYHYQRRKESDATELAVNELLRKINWSKTDDLQENIEFFIIVDCGIKLTPDELENILSKFVSNPFVDSYPLRNLFIDNCKIKLTPDELKNILSKLVNNPWDPLRYLFIDN
jgi:hypothetical protein